MEPKIINNLKCFLNYFVYFLLCFYFYINIIEIEKEKKEFLGYTLPGGDRVFTRKAGFHYGWDWGAKISPTNQ